MSSMRFTGTTICTMNSLCIAWQRKIAKNLRLIRKMIQLNLTVNLICASQWMTLLESFTFSISHERSDIVTTNHQNTPEMKPKYVYVNATRRSLSNRIEPSVTSSFHFKIFFKITRISFAKIQFEWIDRQMNHSIRSTSNHFNLSKRLDLTNDNSVG